MLDTYVVIGIYFKPMSVESLQDAILRLVKKLDSNWQPKWDLKNDHIIASWDDNAFKIDNILKTL